MKNIIFYLKYLGLFIIFIIAISIIFSLINLTGINSSLINKLGVIITGISFFIISALASKNHDSKGYLMGIKLSLIFIILMVIINLILFKSSFNIGRFIYYIILIASAILGGSFGKNLKKKN